MPETMTVAEMASMGGHARAQKLTPEERQESARRARLARTVKAVVDRAPELTEEQKARLRAALAPVLETEREGRRMTMT
jgi:F0F1-type ATP synthase delta subunit